MRLKIIRKVTTRGGNHHAWRIWWRQGRFWPYPRAYLIKWDYRVDFNHSSDKQKTLGSWLMPGTLVKASSCRAWWQRGQHWPLAENVERWDNQGSRVNSLELFLASARPFTRWWKERLSHCNLAWWSWRLEVVRLVVTWGERKER